ncbi:hypothetical protein CCUS01_16218 [Colletotrichum cuscutae]|uniref:Uncharacterized protein n=1 Tax=Colletotrichum cuscutae TaxID=1209917 RepID=A0AAI9Y4G2_9PEZI|nr:hypothetical protein CCUS01_16218 [Colletotrichum cuscutae]
MTPRQTGKISQMLGAGNLSEGWKLGGGGGCECNAGLTGEVFRPSPPAPFSSFVTFCLCIQYVQSISGRTREKSHANLLGFKERIPDFYRRQSTRDEEQSAAAAAAAAPAACLIESEGDAKKCVYRVVWTDMCICICMCMRVPGVAGRGWAAVLHLDTYNTSFGLSQSLPLQLVGLYDRCTHNLMHAVFSVQEPSLEMPPLPANKQTLFAQRSSAAAAAVVDTNVRHMRGYGKRAAIPTYAQDGRRAAGGQKHPGHDPGPGKVPSNGQATAYNSRAQPPSSDRGSFLRGGGMLVVYIPVRPCFPDAWSYRTPLRLDASLLSNKFNGPDVKNAGLFINSGLFAVCGCSFVKMSHISHSPSRAWMVKGAGNGGFLTDDRWAYDPMEKTRDETKKDIQSEKTVAGIESAVVRSPHVSPTHRRETARSAVGISMFLRGGLELFKLTNEGPIGRLTGDGVPKQKLKTQKTGEEEKEEGVRGTAVQAHSPSSSSSSFVFFAIASCHLPPREKPPQAAGKDTGQGSPASAASFGYRAIGSPAAERQAMIG